MKSQTKQLFLNTKECLLKENNIESYQAALKATGSSVEQF